MDFQAASPEDSVHQNSISDVTFKLRSEKAMLVDNHPRGELKVFTNWNFETLHFVALIATAVFFRLLNEWCTFNNLRFQLYF